MQELAGETTVVGFCLCFVIWCWWCAVQVEVQWKCRWWGMYEEKWEWEAVSERVKSGANGGDSSTRYAKFKLGEPEQTVQVDVDMLTADFYLFTTTSRTGSQFFDFHSQTYGDYFSSTCVSVSSCSLLGFKQRVHHILFSLFHPIASRNIPILSSSLHLPNRMNCRNPTHLISRSTEKSNTRPFPRCSLPSELLHLPTSSSEPNLNNTVPITFAHCRPPKSSIPTLSASGAALGLAPGRSLSQMHMNAFSSTSEPPPSLLAQLVDQAAVKLNVWSLMLVDGQQGVLSLGGSSAAVVENVERVAREELHRLGELERGAARKGKEGTAVAGGEVDMRDSTSDDVVNLIGSSPAKGNEGEEVLSADKTIGPLQKRDLSDGDGKGRRGADDANTENSPGEGSIEWTWSKVQGAEGWWQVLMPGGWIDGRRVLKNQPVVLDVSAL